MTLIRSAVCLIALTSVCHADVTFEFKDNSTTIGNELDETTGGSFTVDGVGMTVALNTALTNAVFNATTQGFGIDDRDRTGSTGDQTFAFDFDDPDTPLVNESEGMTLTFDTDVDLVSISFASFNEGGAAGDDKIRIQVGGVFITDIVTGGTTTFSNVSVTAGQTVDILTVDGTYGNGWELVSFTVTPEPSSISLLAVGVLSTLVGGYRRKRSVVAA